MPNVFRVMHDSRRSGQMSRLAVLLACLLIGIRFVIGFIHESCFLDWEQPKVRSFYLHSGGDQNRCHHGKAPSSLPKTWACKASEDEQSFTLPEVPRLPVVVSVFVPLVLLLVSYRTLFLVTAYGRSPPVRVA